MTTFSALKLTATKKPTQIPQVLQRRNKLAKRLWEQIELAKAEQSGTSLPCQSFEVIQIKKADYASRLKQTSD
jgi:hypothetical protein